MKQEKGFTLIELLAVIVILAVIALIAIPQVLNILSKARESAAEDSIYGIVKAAETYATEFMLTNNGKMPREDLVFDCSKENNGCKLQLNIKNELKEKYDLTNLDALDFKGTKPTSGTVTITDNGKTISTSNLIINGFTCTYANGKANCSGEEKNMGYTIEPATGKTYKAIVYLDPTNLETKCNKNNSSVGTGTSGCMKWYAYAETDSTYDLILDHNTTAKVSSFSEAQTQVNTDTQNWDSSLNARNIKADEIATITGHPTFKQETAPKEEWFYLDSNNNTEKIATSQGASNYAWLYDYTGNCTYSGCNTEDSSTVGYWTKNMVVDSSSYAFDVDSNGSLGYTSVSAIHNGVRPVITILKD